ncbi:SMI1/KNR4 family protein [Mesorhizobium sp.]|uniref:SMI1/KNR4 family protein n=1 Tax=Mesorhizobium sp. TaxID=1871066 RepID=UPI00120DB27F|nr:SMI1/KNR4 family protein [Mesorhizobium sp.]TIR31963.1 MAG: SMI1/KNR4 family protein [Mesorhizobium sp.]TIS22557.1 MAG: SMI1/KNR4 family protein [Mesorhizobium sp.]TIS69381.1 MAG: SMI1/KNR4 family protein [Mesorhizobium sp.]
MSLSRFVEKWTIPTYPPESVSEEDLGAAEQQLGVHFPEDYRQAVLDVGLPRPTIALLDAIVERELDLHDLHDFYSPKEIVEETLSWREIGMPDRLVAIASDGSGNKFCFNADQLGGDSAGMRAIWFFDHDFGTVDEVAPSFHAWIDALCVVEPWREEPS